MLNDVRRRLEALGEYYLVIWANRIIYHQFPSANPVIHILKIDL